LVWKAKFSKGHPSDMIVLAALEAGPGPHGYAVIDRIRLCAAAARSQPAEVTGVPVLHRPPSK